MGKQLTFFLSLLDTCKCLFSLYLSLKFYIPLNNVMPVDVVIMDGINTQKFEDFEKTT